MSGRGGYLLRKVGWALLTVLVVITFNFVLFRVLPGDPAKSGLRDPRLNLAAVEALRERFGTDKPVFVDLEADNPFDSQFTAYLGALSRADLGTSYAFRDQPVSDLIGQALVNTLWLVLPSQLLAIEVFRSAAEVPVQFSGGSAACGVVLIWTVANLPPGL